MRLAGVKKIKKVQAKRQWISEQAYVREGSQLNGCLYSHGARSKDVNYMNVLVEYWPLNVSLDRQLIKPLCDQYLQRLIWLRSRQFHSSVRWLYTRLPCF